MPGKKRATKARSDNSDAPTNLRRGCWQLTATQARVAAAGAPPAPRAPAHHVRSSLTQHVQTTHTASQLAVVQQRQRQRRAAAAAPHDIAHGNDVQAAQHARKAGHHQPPPLRRRACAHKQGTQQLEQLTGLPANVQQHAPTAPPSLTRQPQHGGDQPLQPLLAPQPRRGCTRLWVQPHPRPQRHARRHALLKRQRARRYEPLWLRSLVQLYRLRQCQRLVVVPGSSSACETAVPASNIAASNKPHARTHAGTNAGTHAQARTHRHARTHARTHVPSHSPYS